MHPKTSLCEGGGAAKPRRRERKRCKKYAANPNCQQSLPQSRYRSTAPVAVPKISCSLTLTKFWPLPLLFARCICHRQRSQTSPSSEGALGADESNDTGCAQSSLTMEPRGVFYFEMAGFSARWQTAKKVRKTSNSRPSAYIDTVYPQGVRRIRNAPSSRTAAQTRELRSKSKLL